MVNTLPFIYSYVGWSIYFLIQKILKPNAPDISAVKAVKIINNNDQLYFP